MKNGGGPVEGSSWWLFCCATGCNWNVVLGSRCMIFWVVRFGEAVEYGAGEASAEGAQFTAESYGTAEGAQFAAGSYGTAEGTGFGGEYTTTTTTTTTTTQYGAGAGEGSGEAVTYDLGTRSSKYHFFYRESIVWQAEWQ